MTDNKNTSTPTPTHAHTNTHITAPKSTPTTTPTTTPTLESRIQNCSLTLYEWETLPMDKNNFPALQAAISPSHKDSLGTIEVYDYYGPRIRSKSSVGAIGFHEPIKLKTPAKDNSTELRQIIILPKITQGKNDKEKTARWLDFLRMFEIAYKVKFPEINKAATLAQTSGLTSLIAWLYAAEIEKLFRHHLRRNFRIKTETLNSRIKGKLLVKPYIVQSVAKMRPEAAICQFYDLTPDTLINRIIKAALTAARKLAINCTATTPKTKAATTSKTKAATTSTNSTSPKTTTNSNLHTNNLHTNDLHTTDLHTTDRHTNNLHINDLPAQLSKMLGLMANVSDIRIRRSDFHKIRLHAMNRYYRPALTLAQLLLFESRFHHRTGQPPITVGGLLFDMNQLFERYVAGLIEKRHPGISYQKSIGKLTCRPDTEKTPNNLFPSLKTTETSNTQSPFPKTTETSNNHSSKNKTISLLPDLTYKLPEGKLIIVDAKYKDVFAQDSSNTLSKVSEDDPNAKIDLFSNHEFPIKPRVADIYQMAAYLDNRPDADAGFLVYPWLEKTQKLIWVDGCGDKKIGLLAIGICSS